MADFQKLTEDLHVQLAEELLGRLKSGEATTQDLNVMRQFLKDNGVTATTEGAETQANPLGELAKILPFPKTKVA